MGEQQALKLLKDMGVDIFSLLDECPMLYEAVEARGFTFGEFVDAIWEFRPTIASTLRSLSSLRRSMHQKLSSLAEAIDNIEHTLPRMKGESKRPAHFSGHKQCV